MFRQVSDLCPPKLAAVDTLEADPFRDIAVRAVDVCRTGDDCTSAHATLPHRG
jgi:hypothetical protein